MPNGHDLERWQDDWREDEFPPHPTHERRHGRHLPSFIPPRIVIPEHRGFWHYVGRSWFLIVVVLVFFLIVLPWLIALLSLLWAPVKEASSTSVSFFDEVHPYIREWLPTWSLGAVLALAIGAAIRVLRKI